MKWSRLAFPAVLTVCALAGALWATADAPPVDASPAVQAAVAPPPAPTVEDLGTPAPLDLSAGIGEADYTGSGSPNCFWRCPGGTPSPGWDGSATVTSAMACKNKCKGACLAVCGLL